MSEPGYGKPLAQISVDVVRHAIDRAEKLSASDGKTRKFVIAPWQVSDEIRALVEASPALELAPRSDCPGSTVYTVPKRG